MDLFRRVMSLPEPVADWSDAVDGLHASILAAALLGCLGIALYTVRALILYRQPPPFPLTPVVRSPRIVEALAMGALLALFVTWWVLGFHTYVRMESSPPDALDVQVLARQWMWEFVYPDGRSTLDELVVPLGRPVRLLMTSRDVIHSFFVPVLRDKRDVVPGRTTAMAFTATRAGTYPVWCAEFCGFDHSKMGAKLVVLDGPGWEAWSATPPGPTLADRGEKVAAERGCLRCHTVDGTPHLGPTWKGLYGSEVSLADGSRTVADEPYLTESMMDPLAKVVAGFEPVMPTYRGQLDVEETAALVAYLRSLR